MGNICRYNAYLDTIKEVISRANQKQCLHEVFKGKVKRTEVLYLKNANKKYYKELESLLKKVRSVNSGKDKSKDEFEEYDDDQVDLEDEEEDESAEDDNL